MDTYSNAFTEVYTILNYLNDEDYNKIPNEVKEAIEKNRNPEYKYQIDMNIELRKQKMLEKTRAILFNLFKDYLCTEEQRKIIEKQQNEELKKIEMDKQSQYTYDDMFKKRDDKVITTNSKKNLVPVVVYKENLFTKMVNNLKRCLKKFGGK